MRFETEISFIEILAGNIVKVEGKEGVNVDKAIATAVYDEIERKIEGEYRVLLHRKNSYSVTPNTYTVMNNRDRLEKVAIVVTSRAGASTAELEQQWCSKPLNIFSSEPLAMAWLGLS